MTHTSFFPWIIVNTNSKIKVGVEAICHKSNTLPYKGKEESKANLRPDPIVVLRFHTMAKNVFTDQQIIRALRQGENGETVREICRPLGISDQTYYIWKCKYVSLGLSELRDFCQLGDENTNL